MNKLDDDNWLDLEYLTDLHGAKLLDHPYYKREFEPFVEEAHARQKSLYVYVSDKKYVESVRSAIIRGSVIPI